MARTELSGVVQTWGFEKKRNYIVVQVSYGVARVVFKPDLFKAEKGTGEQRNIVASHAKAIKKAILEETYTPTPVSVGLRPRHAKALEIFEDEDCKQVLLCLEEEDSLPLTDGGHRFNALETIREEALLRQKAAMKADDQKLVDKERHFIEQVDALPVTAIVHLNGNTQDDFLNLQLGKPVDTTHLFSMKVMREMFGAKDVGVMRTAFDTAKLLNSDKRSVYYKQIRFDSGSVRPLPLGSLCTKGSSDLGTSLAGLARVGLSDGSRKRGADNLAGCVIAAVRGLSKQAPGLLEEGKVLTPPPDGTKGAATMLIGLGVALAYRLKATGQEVPGERDIAQLVEAAKETLDRRVDSNFGGPAKRSLLGQFVREFFADLKIPKHDGMPTGLLETLSPSAFGARRLPGKNGKNLPEWEAEENPTVNDEEAVPVAAGVEDEEG